MQWVFLMVGGPWHGTFKTITCEAKFPRAMPVLDPMSLTYERAPDFGVINEGRTWYTRRTFDVWNMGQPEAYIEVLLKRYIDSDELGLLVWDAFQQGCANLAKQGYRWE